MTTVIATGRSEPDSPQTLRTYHGHPAYRCAGCGRTLPADPESEVVVSRRGSEVRRFEPSCVPVVRSGATRLSPDVTGGQPAFEETAAPPTCKARLGLTLGLPGFSALRVDLEDVRIPDEPLEEVMARLRRALWTAVEQELRALDAIRSEGALRR